MGSSKSREKCWKWSKNVMLVNSRWIASDLWKWCEQTDELNPPDKSWESSQIDWIFIAAMNFFVNDFHDIVRDHTAPSQHLSSCRAKHHNNKTPITFVTLLSQIWTFAAVSCGDALDKQIKRETQTTVNKQKLYDSDPFAFTLHQTRFFDVLLKSLFVVLKLGVLLTWLWEIKSGNQKGRRCLNFKPKRALRKSTWLRASLS